MLIQFGLPMKTYKRIRCPDRASGLRIRTILQDDAPYSAAENVYLFRYPQRHQGCVRTRSLKRSGALRNWTTGVSR